jgi:hypothetical protein
MATPRLQGRTPEFTLGTDATPTAEVDRTDYVLDFSWNVSADSVAVRAWGSGAFARKLQGGREGTIEITFMDDVEAVMDDVLYDLQDSGQAVNYEYFPDGNSTGKRTRTGTIVLTEINEDNSGEGSDVKVFETTWEMQEQPTRGVVA